ncbi:MAG: membrane protein insertion efficiency factor YidD [Candidatus Omnitrophota bacterium]
MLRTVSLVLISAYQGCIRPLLPSCCRFSPSCSEYTRQAISKYGFFQGGTKGIKRILKCHPFSPQSGYDPLR